MELVAARRPHASLTIVIPVYNEELLLIRFRDILLPVLNRLNEQLQVQVCFVNNGSIDSSLEILSERDFLVEIPYAVLTLTRNFGYETALIAGLTHTDSDLYCLLDADGEDDPELILSFLQIINQNIDIVQGVRRKRYESFGTRWFRSAAYWMLSRISDDLFIQNAGNFAIFTRRVRNAILIENANFPFLRSTFSRSGYPIALVPYDRLPRIDGKSKYRKFSLLKFALAGFLTTTTYPLRFITYLAGFSIPFVFLLGIVRHFYPTSTAPTLTISIIVTEILISFGLISLYIARIYKETLGKPLFYVDWFRSHIVSDFKIIRNLDE